MPYYDVNPAVEEMCNVLELLLFSTFLSNLFSFHRENQTIVSRLLKNILRVL